MCRFDTMKTAIIVPSDKILYFQSCIECILNQSEKFDSIFVIPWGHDKDKIINLSKQHGDVITIMNHRENTTLEENRNVVLDHIKYKEPSTYKYISFIDDDSLLDEKWLEHMKRMALQLGSKKSFASTVYPIKMKDHTNRNKEKTQSLGHEIINTSPRDVCFYKNHSSCTNPTPHFPCGNSAFIPWEAIVQIYTHDPKIWNHEFRQWQTCFAFGIKLRILRYDCELNKDAIVFHEGAIEKKNRELNESDVKGQLRSRFLLYKKYYPKAEYQEAIQVLNEKLETIWKKKGYPSSIVMKDKIESIFNTAKEEADSTSVDEIWKELIEKMPEEERKQILINPSDR